MSLGFGHSSIQKHVSSLAWCPACVILPQPQLNHSVTVFHPLLHHATTRRSSPDKFLSLALRPQHSLKEVLANELVAGQISNTKAARETSALAEFYAMLSDDPSRAFYGPGHVLAAAELGAVQVGGTSWASPVMFCTSF